MWYTIVFGAPFEIVAAAIARRRGTAAAPEAPSDVEVGGILHGTRHA